MSTNYEALENELWDSIAQRADYKSTDGILYLAILRLSKRMQSTFIEDEDEALKKLSRLSWNTYYKCMDWLTNTGVILYQKSTNQNNPSKLQLLSLAQFEATEQPALSQRASGEPPAESSSHVRDLEYNNINNKSLAESSAGDSIPPLVQTGEPKIIAHPPLQSRVDQFKEQNPKKYPEKFYDSFVQWYSKPDDRKSGRQIWEAILEKDGLFNLGARLEDSWGKMRQDFPGWVVGIGYPDPSEQHRNTSTEYRKPFQEEIRPERMLSEVDPRMPRNYHPEKKHKDHADLKFEGDVYNGYLREGYSPDKANLLTDSYLFGLFGLTQKVA